MVMLFSKVLPQSTFLQHCFSKLWIYRMSMALVSNFGTLQGNSRRCWAQRCREKISPDVVICLSEPLDGMVGERDADLDTRTLEFHSHLGHALCKCSMSALVCSTQRDAQIPKLGHP